MSKILPFTEYVVRTPLLPMSFYLNLIENYSAEKAKELYQNSLIREAINLASPDLKKELDKWVKNDSDLSDEKEKKLEITLLKYIARTSSRCTPFGLFAGCSLGGTAAETKITLEGSDKYKRVTQFDMQFWVALLQEIANKKEAKSHLKYYPNNSIYKIGDFYRYVEYKYVETKREHSITALRKSDVLAKLLLKAKSGLTINQMVLLLADNENEKIEAYQFILKLIDFQFLVSELDASITGDQDWKRVLTVLHKIPGLEKECQFLENVQKQLSGLDETLIPSEEKYEEIKNEIRKIGIPFDEKYLFQTDLNTSASVNTLSANVSKKVIQALYFLNGIQPKNTFKNQENFKKAFIERYESRTMPLTTVLDTEIGIGYLQNQEMNDSHDILEFLSLKSKKTKTQNQTWTSYDFVLQKKLVDCMLKQEKVISLSEKDFTHFNADLKDVPATFSVMIEVFGEDEIVLESSGDVSAAKLLGRFCTGNQDIHNLTREIIQKEEEYYSDKIMAEIAHIPESRTGNILRRPVLRKHEISYLAKSGADENYNIDLNDLSIAVENDTVILHSKKHNKVVIPCLSNAHNFSKGSLPIYHFLCDLQSQHIKPIYSFDWGVLKSHYDFFPRVLYRDIILSKAKWIVKREEIKDFFKMNDKQLSEAFSIWKSNRNIPQYVNWVNGDNTLLFDFETKIGVELFLKSVQNREKITLEEFLFTKKSVVQNQEDNDFCNQFILSFYKE
ncbi:lantibiotic dehydratase family protein [Flavobacterium sp. MR2016-29]|uniref:lantibiotic dehydratase family protein n=1 Tax=Flavobacterium sp. MR2016-29 TaxID=2783795 RepID=UPI00188B3AB0|nr:lantibiotic dehydratase family protein [Flavobacterium sp. MR2016-29]MBF4494634.1 lantibiotic dehydratase family protein [Flavobacterium sp. MR2016-29]